MWMDDVTPPLYLQLASLAWSLICTQLFRTTVLQLWEKIFNQIWGLDSELVVWHSRVFLTRNLLLHNDLFTFGLKLFPRLISLITICCWECQFIIKLCTAYTDCGCGCTKSIVNLSFAKTAINIWSCTDILLKYLISLYLISVILWHITVTRSL